MQTNVIVQLVLCDILNCQLHIPQDSVSEFHLTKGIKNVLLIKEDFSV